MFFFVAAKARAAAKPSRAEYVDGVRWFTHTCGFAQTSDPSPANEVLKPFLLEEWLTTRATPTSLRGGQAGPSDKF